MENKNASIISIVSLFFTCILVITLTVLFYSSTKAGPSNKVCEKKATQKNLIKKDKSIYEISSASKLGKGLVLEVTDWSNITYKTDTKNKFKCIAAIESSNE